MRTPLKKFTAFTKSLLPNETAYLCTIQQFHDEERLAILERVNLNVQSTGKFIPYDTKIDKRKYHPSKVPTKNRITQEYYRYFDSWEQSDPYGYVYNTTITVWGELARFAELVVTCPPGPNDKYKCGLSEVEFTAFDTILQI